MSDLLPIGRTPTASPPAIQPAAASKQPDVAEAVEQGGSVARQDRVELSAMARYLAKLAELPEVRMDLIEAVRVQIAAGTYETPEKIEAILDELLADLNREV